MGIKPADLAVVRVAVQQQVQVRADETFQIVGVAQVFVVLLGRAEVVVVQHAQPEPVLPLKPPQLGLEPLPLGLAYVAVVRAVLVAFGDSRVEAGNDQLQVGHFVQRPRLFQREADRFGLARGQVAVEGLKQIDEMAPLGPVRRQGLPFVGFTVVEVRLASHAIDVVVARHEHDAGWGQGQVGRQAGQERADVLELQFLAHLGQIARDDDQLRGQPFVGPQLIQIVRQSLQQRVKLIIGRRQAEPTKAMLGAELNVRQVQQGDRSGFARGHRQVPGTGAMFPAR